MLFPSFVLRGKEGSGIIEGHLFLVGEVGCPRGTGSEGSWERLALPPAVSPQLENTGAGSDPTYLLGRRGPESLQILDTWKEDQSVLAPASPAVPAQGRS